MTRIELAINLLRSFRELTTICTEMVNECNLEEIEDPMQEATAAEQSEVEAMIEGIATLKLTIKGV